LAKVIDHRSAIFLRKDVIMFNYFKRTTEVLVLFLCILIPLASIAQIQTKRMAIEKRVKLLSDKLKLNGDQIKKIKFILEDQSEELAAAMNANRDNRQAADDAIAEITKNTDDKIKAILTEKQMEMYIKIIEERAGQTNKQIKDSTNLKTQNVL
jgi:hypothetical protein